MGNCQAVDTASLVIQHPGGKSETLFWPIPASQVMKTNPGHYVALLITTTTTTTTSTVPGAGTDSNKTTVRITRVKLLKPTDTLTLGHVYRLISTEEVMKGLVAKKQAKMMKMKQADDMPKKPLVNGLKEVGGETKQDMAGPGRRSAAAPQAAIALGLGSAQPKKSNQMSKHEMQQQRSSSALKSKPWQPSLKSISEALS